MIEPPTPNADNTILDSTRKGDSDDKGSKTYSDNEDEAMEIEIESLLKEISY